MSLPITLTFQAPDRASDQLQTDMETLLPQIKEIAGIEAAALAIMIAIPGGTFWMGSADGVGSDAERPRHEVAIAPFWMSKYQITQAQYKAITRKTPSRFEGDQKPVEHVSWWEAIAFCEQLTTKGNYTFRLPSESEWEYACRAGTQTLFYFGDTISAEQVNYENKSGTTDVGIFPANKFGLHDMHGNVWEWCADHWHKNYKGATTDESASITASKDARRLLRGGSWFDNPDYCRSALRNNYSPVIQRNNFGFRVVCS
jgi:formylglycine-generating enzyme required for sulfatase activity